MVAFENVSFFYPDTKQQILKDYFFQLNEGELLSLMGASGSGKTTVLQLIAGLLKPQSGKIRSNELKIAYVFQEPRLFPWLSVKDNLKAVQEKEDPGEIEKVLRFIGLEEDLNIYPEELSGGMKMRVSLARALLSNATLYLLDEPFAALDEDLRIDLTIRLRNYFKEKNASAILVTHDTPIAKLFSDRILKLE